jgi:hypothetical protein
MEMQVPTGYFLDDHQIWGDPGAGAIMSRTYAADFPDLSASDDSAFDLMESNCRLMMASLRQGERLQLNYYTSNDFNRPLDRYAAQTAKSKIEICSKVRGDIEARFRKLMDTERLIQANVRISLSAKLPSFCQRWRAQSARFLGRFQDLRSLIQAARAAFQTAHGQSRRRDKGARQPRALRRAAQVLVTWPSTPPYLQGSGLDAHGR